MVDFQEDDVARALAQLYQRNKKQQHKQENDSNKKRAQKNVFKDAERKFLARKIFEPCAVKQIYPFSLTKEQCDFLVPEFLSSSHGYDPREYTMAMECAPFTVLVQMENKLVYMAAISQIMPIHWPGGLAGEIKRKMEKAAGGNLNFKEQKFCPTLLADTCQYYLRLYPMHLNKDICQHDYLGVLWRSTEDITDPKTKTGLIHPLDGQSFEYLLNGAAAQSLPSHICQLLGQVQKRYDQARAEKKIGEPVYARFDPDKPAHRGWTIPICPWGKREYFDIPGLRYVHSARPSQIACHSDRKISLKPGYISEHE